MNILHVTHSHGQGGVENFMLNHYDAIDREKYNFVFLTFDVPGPYALSEEFARYGGRTYFVSANTIKLAGYRAKSFAKVRRIIEKERIDMVHIHPYVGGEIVATIAKTCRVPVIAHSHASAVTGGARGLRKLVKKCVIRGMMAYSNWMTSYRLACNKLAGKFYFGNRKFRIVKNGIDLSKFRFCERRRRELRKEYGIGKEEKVILHVGRFVKDKNHKFLLEILKELREKDNLFKLVLVGDGVLFDEVRRKVEMLGLESSVIFLGLRNDVSEILNMADVFVLPSLSEGLGIVLIEAQANGLKCVASDTVPRESDQTGSVEFISLDEPAGKWAHKIRRMNLARRAENYKKLLASDYNVKNSVKELESIYEEIYAETQRKRNAKS